MKSVEPILISDYSPEWPKEFKDIGKALRNALGEVANRIDHIGSTSVPGLAAKPIIDIQISVCSLEPVEPFLIPMESLGYVWKKNNGEKTKRYFREKPGTRRTHIHTRKLGSWHQQFALLFRDYIRLHPSDHEKYERVKRELAERYRYERQTYVDAKDPIIHEIMHRADRWAADVGWEPGLSDV